MTEPQKALPVGWRSARIGELTVERVAQGAPETAAEYIDIGSIDRATKRVRETKAVTGEDAPTRARQWVESGDVLVSMTRPNLNAVAIVPPSLDGAVATTGFDVLRATDGVDPKWLFYRVRTAEFVADMCKGLQGVVYPAIRPRDVREHVLPAPPEPEQTRIVEAIETQFTRLDAAEQALERVQANLERYRASALKAAVEGRLVPTEAEFARKEGRSYEPASELLEHILTERRRRWEQAELAKMKAKGKEPKNDNWKKKYKPPQPPDTDNLPELPEGWCWATVDQLGEVSGGLTKNSKRRELPLQIPYLRVANVYTNELRLDEVLEIGLRKSEVDRVLLQKGDLLVVEGNGSLDQIGRVAIWDGSIDPCVHQNHLIKVRFSDASLEPWVLTWMLSVSGRGYIRNVASSTAGLYNLSLSKVRSIPVPVAPLEEQSRIEDALAVLLPPKERAKVELETARARCQNLRQAILKWAFDGRLTEPDLAA